MTNKDYYFLSKLAKAEKTIKQATVTTCTHKALTPTEPVAPALGESDKIMYGQGSVAKAASIPESVGVGVLTGVGIGALANTAGQLAAMGEAAKKQGAVDDAYSLLPGVAAYRQAHRRRLMDIQRSGGKRDRSAQLHELAGSITNTLLLTLLGAGVGGAYGYYTGEGAQRKSRAFDSALLGGLAGMGTGTLAQVIGSIPGALSTNKKAREEYLKGDNMWKNYMIPGYAGYQTGAGARDVLDAHLKDEKK